MGCQQTKVINMSITKTDIIPSPIGNGRKLYYYRRDTNNDFTIIETTIQVNNIVMNGVRHWKLYCKYPPHEFQNIMWYVSGSFRHNLRNHKFRMYCVESIN